MKQFVTKYSILYWIVLVVLAIVPFVASDDAPWTWALLGLAFVMAVYYFTAKIQG